jgi:hypothetical protein
VLLILVGTALIINWNNMFHPSIEKKPFVTIGDSVAPYTIAVYYFPGQKNAAKGLSHYFKQQGYIVDLLPAEGVKHLEYKRFAPSHIFFKTEELAQAMGVKKTIEKIVGHPVSAYRFVESQDKISMMVVFTNT